MNPPVCHPRLPNPLEFPICFMEPKWLPLETPAWHEHIPFAMVLVDLVKPKIIVELGTHLGCSYCAFCQAVKNLNLDSCCYAVDTWQGDSQAGFYGMEILRDLRAHHDPLYGSFSTLIQSTFEEALPHFADGTINLLHIDGYHTYESVKNDFNSWLPKMAPGGVILFHDINVRQGDFGVHRFWNEVKVNFPFFEFFHGHGLGVLGLPPLPRAELQAMMDATGDTAHQIRHFFFQVSSRLVSKANLPNEFKRSENPLTEQERSLTAKISEKETSILELENDLSRLEEALAEKDEALKGWIAEKDKLRACRPQATEQSCQNQPTEHEDVILRLQQDFRRLEDLMSEKEKALTTHISEKEELLVAQIKEKEKGIQELTSQFQQKNEAIKSLTDEVIYLEKMRRFLHGKVEEKDQRLLVQSQENQDQDKTPRSQTDQSESIPLVAQQEMASHQEELQQQVAALQGELAQIKSSKSWQAVQALRPVAPFLRLPFRLGRAQRKAIRIWKQEGFPSLLRKGWGRIRRSWAKAPLHSGGLDCLPRPTKEPFDDFILCEKEVLSQAKPDYLDELENFSSKPLISIVVPVYNCPLGILKKTIASVAAQLYEGWELCLVDDCSQEPNLRRFLEKLAGTNPKIRVFFRPSNGHISAATNDGISKAEGLFVAFLDHDDELTEDALFHVVRRLNEKPETDIIYSDQDKRLEDNRRAEPFFKPDWSPEYLRGVMYLGHLLVVRRSLLLQVGGCESRFNGVQDFELALRLSEKTSRIEHISRILYHWRAGEGSVASRGDAKPHIDRLQEQAVQEHLDRLGIPAVAVKHGQAHRVRLSPKFKSSGPLVSILIPTRDMPDYLGKCLDSIFSRTRYPHLEVIIGDNETTDPKALELLEGYPVKRVPLPGPFHFSAFTNQLARAARGEYLVLLNNDTEVISPDWIDHLLLYAERRDVGAVGPLLLYPDQSVQHAGVIFGPRGTADHIMRGFPGDSDGYAGSLYCTREVSAVTGACMMVAKEKYNSGGGLNEHFRRHYEDVDFCLRLRAKGLRNIYVAAATLIHHESKSRGSVYNYTDRVLLLDSWEHQIERGDPFYNANFNRSSHDYSLWTEGLRA